MRIGSRLGSILFILAVALTPPHALAHAPDSTSQRPKVGLVLSGGGARGFIHIGLLRVLEEEGLRPDIVTGTSMGAIIGALYAIGYTPDQLSHLNTTIDWDKMLSNGIDLREVVVDQKRWQGRFLLSLTKDALGFHLPRGLIEGQKLWDLLHRLTYPVAREKDFDAYPSPFRAIAVDISRGRAQEFSEGSLPKAIRASMAIPGVFTPVVYHDTAIYIDGGVADNFPIETAKAMGAKVLIGSYAGPPLENIDPTGNYSTKDIIKQATLFAGIQKARAELNQLDILFAPDLHGKSSMGFGKGLSIEEYGYREAEKLRPKIRALAKRLNTIGANPTVLPIDSTRRYRIEAVRVEGIPNKLKDFAESRLQLALPGALSAEDIEESVHRLFSTLYFERITYTIDSGQVLHLNTTLREKLKLELSFQINGVYGPSLQGHLSILNPILPSSRLSVAVGLSYHPWAEGVYTQYFSQHTNLLLRNRLHYSSTRFPTYAGMSQMASVWRHQVYNQLELGLESGRNALLTVGGCYKFRHYIPNKAFSRIQPVNAHGYIIEHTLSPYIRFVYNSYDQPYYPHEGNSFYCHFDYRYTPRYLVKGSEGNTQAYSHGNKEMFRQQQFSLVADYHGYIPIGRRLTLSLGGSGAIMLGGSNLYSEFKVGGQEFMADIPETFPFYGLGYRMLPYRTMGIGRCSLRIRTWSSLYLEPTLNALWGIPANTRMLGNLDIEEQLVLGGALRVGSKTPIGILEGAIGTSSFTLYPWFYLMVGFPL